MDQLKLKSFVEKLDEYYEIANSDSSTEHPLKASALLKLARELEPNLLPFFTYEILKTEHKIVLFHLLNKLEYLNSITRKDCPYPINAIKTIYINALEDTHEPMQFQAFKCTSIAANVAKEDAKFGDYFYSRIVSALSSNSQRLKTHALYLLSVRSPDSVTRSLPSLAPIKKILEEKQGSSTFQALQYLRGKTEVYVELKPVLQNYLKELDKDETLDFPELFLRYLSEGEIVKFAQNLIKYNTIKSISSLLELLKLNKIDELKELCKSKFDTWYESFEILRPRISELAIQLNLKLKSQDENKVNDLPEAEFLSIVSNKRVEGTLPRILKIFAANAIMIYRGDGGYDIMSAVSYYSKSEVMACTSAFISSQALNDALNYCKD